MISIGAVIVSAVGNALAPKPRVPRDPLQDRLVSEQLAQLQTMRNLAPLLASQQTLAGIANARAAMENLLRQAAERQGLMGTVDSAALEEARGRALAGFGEAVARLRQQQPLLLAQLLESAGQPLAALQELSAQRQAQAAQEAAMQQQAQQAWGQILGSLLPMFFQQRPQRQSTVPAGAKRMPRAWWEPQAYTLPKW